MAGYCIFSQFIYIFVVILPKVQLLEIDQNGYLTYCPCMGRFGNQVDHFLGSLNFAKALNRTLILPPWIEYRQGELRSMQVPFDRYFQVQAIQEYHRVITMHNFMEKIADTIWPNHIRTSFCYMERKSLTGSTKRDCHAKEGNPFGAFWDEFDIDFVDSEFFAPLHYDVIHSPNTTDEWSTKYSASDWPVLSFTGAPAAFPVQAENVGLQKYLVWTDQMQTKATKWIKSNLPIGSYLGIHLRNGIDWNRACEHINDSPNLFSAAQCLGYRNENGVATQEMCQPSKELIFKQIKRQIKIHNGKHPTNPLKSIFVASDRDHMINELNNSLRHLRISVFRLTENNPHLDLIILERSNLFIGNCISSYSAFVIRSRNVRGLPSSFWARDNALVANNKRNPKTYERDEL